MPPAALVRFVACVFSGGRSLPAPFHPLSHLFVRPVLLQVAHLPLMPNQDVCPFTPTGVTSAPPPAPPGYTLADAVAKLERVGEGHPLAAVFAKLEKVVPGAACVH